MKQDIAVNQAERIRLRGMRSRDWRVQGKLEKLSFEAIEDVGELERWI